MIGARLRNPVLCALFILSAGCATAVPKDIVSKVSYYGDFSTLRESPENFTGEFVLLGGTIVEVRNEPPFSNMIVLQSPLDRNHRPRVDLPSEGRFLVRSETFLDPAIYGPGTLVTAAGTIAGRDVRPVGAYPYVYPVIVPDRIWKWDLDRDPYPRFHFGIGIGTFF